MKVAVLSILLYGCAGASIRKEWLGDGLEYVKLTDSTAIIADGDWLSDYEWRTKKDTLHIFTYSWSGEHFENATLMDYPYKIQSLTEDSMILESLDFKIDLWNTSKHVVRFAERTKWIDTTIHFERISVSGTECLGRCPRFKVEVSSVGRVVFLGMKNTEPFLGLYEGQLNPMELVHLNRLIQQSGVEQISTELGVASDAPMYELVFHYNGRLKKSKGTKLPLAMSRLVNYLSSICEVCQPVPMIGPYEFEF